MRNATGRGLSPLPGPRGRRLVALGRILGVAAASAILAGCASSPATTRTVSGSIVAPSGPWYIVTLTEQADQACTAERYEVIRAKVKNVPQTSSFCGPIEQTAPSRLIQVARPAPTLIVDRPNSADRRRSGWAARGRGRPARSAAPPPRYLRLTLVRPGACSRSPGSRASGGSI